MLQPIIKYLFISIIIATVAGGMCSCYEKPKSKTKGEVMRERLEDRLDRWQTGMENNCREAVIAEAVAIVDSTLLAHARLKRDTSGMPKIPGRPVRPEFVLPKDSTQVKPLIGKPADTLSGPPG